MQYSFVILLLVSAAFIGLASAGNDYRWGEKGPDDFVLSEDKVSKAFFVLLEVTTTYTFKQKDNLNAFTITAIEVNDLRKKDGATAVLTSGGPGSKGATINFRSTKGNGISDQVIIYGR